MERAAAILAAAAVIALVVAAAGLAYAASLAGRLSKVEEGQSALENTTTDVVKALGDVRDALRSLGKSLESLERAVESQGAASENLSAALSQLEGRISSIEERLSELEEQLYYPVTVTDATGDQVTLYRRPERIVSLAPSVTEILFAVGAGGQVVGVDEYSNYPPEVLEAVENGSIAVIGGFWNPSLERILALNPDLVIGVASAKPHLQVKEALSRYGIPVVLLPDKSLEDILESIVTVGILTGHRLEASQLAAQVEDGIRSVYMTVEEYKAREGIEARSVALISWINPIWTTGSGTFQNDLIMLAGGVNPFNETSGWITVSPEELLAADPDVIIATGGHGSFNYTTLMDYLKSVLGDAVYNITAVREGRVYVVHGSYEDVLNRPGPRVALGVRLIAVLAYPEAFGLSPDAIPHDVTPESFTPP
ncbi:ABC transporter substrate-binding protein [Stetteria hydrogenophila]